MSNGNNGYSAANIAAGIILAVFILFVVLPMASCVGCTACSALLSVTK